MQLNDTNLSHLFTVRIWIEFVDCETDLLRIKVQHVLSGEVRYFRDWGEAVAFIAEQSVGQQDSQETEKDEA